MTGSLSRRPIALFLATGLMAACQMTTPETEILRASETPGAPPGADPESCFSRHVTPAIIETVTEQVLVQPPQIDASGTVSYPAVYRTETRQEIVRERKELWFETLCREDWTPEFIASVQRALAVRGYYHGTAHGRMDHATRRAIRTYQLEQGVDSEVLSLAAARQLGLKEVPREE
ncbi:peptidoglycan-binding domain-containing protein [Celeribacter halophilus]|uniref:peptidoglycan-binding domain-containing protein n=1 Tax=Celeribacter halophilus TaxID=576117 RepID=UPI002FD49E61